jgi:hypothetical protein
VEFGRRGERGRGREHREITYVVVGEAKGEREKGGKGKMSGSRYIKLLSNCESDMSIILLMFPTGVLHIH